MSDSAWQTIEETRVMRALEHVSGVSRCDVAHVPVHLAGWPAGWYEVLGCMKQADVMLQQAVIVCHPQ